MNSLIPVGLTITSALERSLLAAVCVFGFGTLAAIVTMYNATHEVTAHRASRFAITSVIIIFAILGTIVALQESGPPDLPGARKGAGKSLLDLIYPSES